MGRYQELFKGHHNCEKCSGKGFYDFKGSLIPCESCKSSISKRLKDAGYK